MDTVATATETEVKVIERMNVDDIKQAPFNPPSRITARALGKLKQQIEAAGEIIQPLIVSSDNYLADGHRRLAIARELGYATVPVIRKTQPLAELWPILNAGQLAVRPAVWMQAARLGLPLERVPELDRHKIEELMRVMGKRGFDRLADDGVSPNIINQARMVAHYCDNDSAPFLKAVILWFREHGQQLEARHAIDLKCPPEVLENAVNENRPIRQYWGIA